MCTKTKTKREREREREACIAQWITIIFWENCVLGPAGPKN